MNGETCNGLGWCVKRDAAPLGEPWCDGAGRCVKGYAAAVNGDDGLREAIARALVTSDADAHGSYAWDECSEELRADYRRYAAAVLALREVAALRAKAAAADRVRALHRPWRDLPICQECTDEITVGWPCPTIAALDGPSC